MRLENSWMQNLSFLLKKALVSALCLFFAPLGFAQVTATHSTPGYFAGASASTAIIVTNTVTYPADKVLTALYLTNSLPSGWVMTGVTGGHGTSEVNTNFNELSFLGPLPTENPVVFTYEIQVPVNQTGLHSLSSILGYRFEGDDDVTEIPFNPDPLELKMRVDVAADPADKVYAQTDPALTYQVVAGELLLGDVFVGTLTRESGEDVGDYEIQQGTLAVNSLYNIIYTPADFTITPLPVILSGIRPYDGTTDADYSILTVVNKVGMDDVSVVSGSGTLASANVGSQVINSFGTLTLGGNDSSNYTLTGAQGEVMITAAGASVQLSDLSQTYDGTERVPTVTTIPSGLTYSITYDGSTQAPVNAGSYEVIALITDNNYTGGTTGTLVVAQLPVTLSGTRVYDGTTVAAYSILTVANKIGMDDVSVVSGNGTLAGADVGLHALTSFGTLTLGGADAANYTLTGAQGEVTITAASASVQLSDLSQTYDGTERVPTVTTIPGGLTYSITYDGSTQAPVNAGSYQVIATITDGNYIGSAIGTLVVAQLPVTLSGTRAYDETTVAAYSILTVDNKVGADQVGLVSGSGTVASANVGLRSITDFGTLTLGGADASNYTLTGAQGNVEITPQTATLHLLEATFTYDGTEKPVSILTYPQGLPCNITYDGDPQAPVNAGLYEVIATIADENYTGYGVWGLRIKQLPVVLSGTRHYDGTTAANHSILTVDNKVGADDVNVVSGSGTLAGADIGLQPLIDFGTLTLGGADSPNYTLVDAEGSVLITEIPGDLPVILTQPESLTVTVGDPAGFAITAVGTEPLFYQWYKNGVEIPGATVAAYNIAFAVLTDAGEYTCSVSNLLGMVMSLPAALTVLERPRVINDYDGDGMSDGVIIDQFGIWRVVYSSTGYATQSVLWNSGLSGAIPVPGDYNGSRSTDPGMYDPATKKWYIVQNDTVVQVPFGFDGYQPVQADYDGDGKTDPCLYHPQTGTWIGLASALDYAVLRLQMALGGPGFQPVPADYDGDGKADPAVYGKTTGQWIVLLSGSNYQKMTFGLGGPDQVPVPLDYDGDGKADPAVLNIYSGMWQVAMSEQNYALMSAVLGAPRSNPIAADYDGDGKADPAVYDMVTGLWRIYLSSQNYALLSGYFGDWEYTPVTEIVGGIP